MQQHDDSRSEVPRRVVVRAGAVVVLTVALALAVSGAMALPWWTDSAAQAAGRRPKPTPTLSPTPTPPVTPTPTPTPTATPTPTPSQPPGGCDHAVIWSGTTYCSAYVGQLLANVFPAGSAVVVRGVPVYAVSGRTITVNGGFWCPPGMYCGATLQFLDVTFPAGATVPAYGDVIDLYGRAITRGLAPDGFTVIGHCLPDFDC